MTGHDDAKAHRARADPVGVGCCRTTARVVVPRDYAREPLCGGGDVARFVETVADFRAQVTRIDAPSIGVTIKSLVSAAGPVVVPADLPTDWVDGVDALVDDPAKPLSIA